MNPKHIIPRNTGQWSAVPNSSVVRVSGPEDLLAYIPYRLGFEPVESVVAVSLLGSRQRVGLVARADMKDLLPKHPDAPDGSDGAATARWLSHHVVADGADRAVVILYTATDTTAPSSPARQAVEMLRSRLEHRIPGTETWLVTPTGFRAIDCVDRMCCPPQGRPLAALQGSQVAAHMVLQGRTVATTREERYALPVAPEAARIPARRAATRWATTYRTLLEKGTDGSPDALAEWGAKSLEVWRSAVRTAGSVPRGQTPALSPVDLGKIGAALADLPVRDAVLLSLAPGSAQTALRTARREVDGGTDQVTGTVMARIVDQKSGLPPDEESTVAARQVLRAIIAHVPGHRRAPAYLLLGLMAWWQGDGGLAAERVSDALGVDPGYRLALLLRGVIAEGIAPGWVRRERAEADEGPEAGEGVAV